MKHDDVSTIDPELHERLCAYVFGELGTEERAAFERELARSPALRAEHERLVATVGLVKRALPDEGLSQAVRRDLVAAARRSRFRRLSGRRLVSLAAAAVVIVGAALAWRHSARESAPGRSTLTAKLVDKLSFPPEELFETPDPVESATSDALKGLGYIGVDFSNAIIGAGAPSSPGAAAGRADGRMGARKNREPRSEVGAEGFFFGHGGKKEEAVADSEPKRGAYRGAGDSVPPSAASTGVRDGAEFLGTALQSLRVEGDEDANVRELGYEGVDSPQEKTDGFSDAPRVRAREEVRRQHTDTRARELVAWSELQPGETPRDMFYRFYGDAPFVPAVEERVSTFAADVDTASYALARAHLERGVLPPREAVRTEEFVNYFKADRPPPTDGKPFALGLELAPSPFGPDARAEMLRVTVRAKDVPEFERPPVALTFVIDNSGSMAGEQRLGLVQRTLSLLLGRLDAADSVAVVKFSSTAAVVTPRLPLSQRAELEAAIRGLGTEGGTNVEGGLRLGYQLALRDLQPRAVNRVILCSDGVGNIGETSAKGLLALVDEARKKGIYLNTVGIGMGNHDDAFLEQLADEGDGVCNYVDGDDEARRVFVDGLSGALVPIARDVKIQVEFETSQVESWRLLGYENRALRTQDFRNDKIDAGEVHAGHQVSALYELVRLPGRAGTVATVRVRYKPPFAIDAGHDGERARAAAEEASEIERALSSSDVLPGFASASDGYQRTVLVAQFAEVLRQSVHARGDSLVRLVEEARRLEGRLRDPDFAGFVALLAQANPLLDERAREDTPRLQELLDRLARLHYEEALRERRRELARQAGEADEGVQPGTEEAQRAAREEIRRLEAEVHAELRQAQGPASGELEALRGLGYAGDD
jgi:Ca-activated chloride channel family protein